jgi:hypothetical protein
MTSADLKLASGAFATPGAGSGYFATAEHYHHVAKGVVDALRRGGLVLVTGDPPACLPMLGEALRKAAAPRVVIEISCSPALDCREPFGNSSSVAPASPKSDEGEGNEAGSTALPSPILVFDDADQLSEVQIKVLFDAAQAAPAREARVLLAHSSFTARFEGPLLDILKGRLAAHLLVQQLDHDEVEAFIRYQLPPDSGSNFLTAQRVALIAITSGGDPGVVNRLARRMLEGEPGASSGRLLAKRPWRSGVGKPVGEELAAEPDASITEGETTPRPSRRRSAGSLKLAAGAVVCLGILALIVGAYGSKDFDNILRNHVLPLLPHRDGSVPVEGTPGRAALPMAPPVAGGSSSAAVTVETPRAAAPEAAAAPVAMAPERPRVAASSPSATPEPTGSPAPSGPRLSDEQITALVARGDAFLSGGDIASARLFFQRAADAGDGRAAMRLAVTFDAAFLDRAGVHGVRGDPEQAAYWYRRARELGEAKTGGTAPSTEPPSQPR